MFSIWSFIRHHSKQRVFNSVWLFLIISLLSFNTSHGIMENINGYLPFFLPKGFQLIGLYSSLWILCGALTGTKKPVTFFFSVAFRTISNHILYTDLRGRGIEIYIFHLMAHFSIVRNGQETGTQSKSPKMGGRDPTTQAITAASH